MKPESLKSQPSAEHPSLLRQQTKTGLMAVLIAAAVYLLIAQPWEHKSAGGMVEGAVAPGFALKPLDLGPIVRLDSFAGKVVMVSFWATWCEPCKQELPALAKISTDMDPARFQLITITDEPATVVKVLLNELQQKHGPMPLVVLLDQGARTQVAYGVRNLPTAVFLGPDQRVMRSHVGAQTESAWRQEIGELLTTAFPEGTTR